MIGFVFHNTIATIFHLGHFGDGTRHEAFIIDVSLNVFDSCVGNVVLIVLKQRLQELARLLE